MESTALFERDLLYPTETLYEFGSIHVSIFSPSKEARIPVVIENKSQHSPIKYIDAIVRIMQTDIFDRILVNVKKNVDLYLLADNETAAAYGGKYIRIAFREDNHEFNGVDTF